MRFLSILKVNRNRRFDYSPVFYDPVKEDLDRRVQDAEAKLKAEKSGEIEPQYSDRISNSFRQNRKKPSIWEGFTSNTAFIRLVIAVALVGIGYGYLEYGEQLSKLDFMSSSPMVIVIFGFGILYAIARFSFAHRRKKRS